MMAFTLSSVSFPFEVDLKVTYFALSPYSFFFASDTDRPLAFSTSLFISYLRFLASVGLYVTTLFSLMFTFFFFPLSSVYMYENSSIHSLQ